MKSFAPACFIAAVLFVAAFPARAETPAVSDGSELLPAVVDELEINGLWRTKRIVIDTELPWKPGETVTAEAWETGLARVESTGIFSRVHGRLEKREEKVVAVLDLEERWTIMLLLQFGGGGGAMWGRVGLYDINTFGRYMESGALYERFDRYNGFQVWGRLPRLFQERQELYMAADRLVRPRPGFALQRTGLHFEYSKQLTEKLTTGGRVDAVLDQFLPPLSGEADPQVDSKSILATYWLRVGRTYPRRLLLEGWRVDFKPTFGFTDAPGNFGFAQLFVEGQAFKIIGSRLVLGARLQAGASTDTQAQHRFYLGGLETIRGYEDNHVRTDLFGLVNLEARYLAFDSMLLALMPTLFVDLAAAHDDRIGARALASAGAGVRVIIPRLYRSGLRIDFPIALTPLSGPDISIGVYQFFD